MRRLVVDLVEEVLMIEAESEVEAVDPDLDIVAVVVFRSVQRGRW